MRCSKHKEMVCGNMTEKSFCQICEMEFYTFNSPPRNMVCPDCSEKFKVCEVCGRLVEGVK